MTSGSVTSVLTLPKGTDLSHFHHKSCHWSTCTLKNSDGLLWTIKTGALWIPNVAHFL